MSVLLEEALKLPVAARIRMADRLYESVGEPTGSTPLTDLQLAEIERRLDHLQKYPEATIPWDEVRDKWRRRA